MIIAIVGPTGVGKTKLSIELAKKYNGEIINADSTQIFKEMNIGTAKVEDMEGIVHYLIDEKSIEDNYTVYDYQKEGRNLIEMILSKNKTVIIAGGSNLYLSALLYDYKFDIDENKIENNLTNEELADILLKNYPDINIDMKNRRRLLRTYEKHLSGTLELNENAHEKLLYDVDFVGLTTDREILYEKINSRVDKMIDSGLIGESKDLFLKYGNNIQLNSTIGYKELNMYFKNLMTLDEAIAKIKQNSRKYAKRQYTWLNNKMNVVWFRVDFDNFDKTVAEVSEYIENKKRD